MLVDCKAWGFIFGVRFAFFVCIIGNDVDAVVIGGNIRGFCFEKVVAAGQHKYCSKGKEYVLHFIGLV